MNSIERLSNIITLLCSEQLDASYKSISAILGISEMQIRDDLLHIISSEEFAHAIELRSNMQSSNTLFDITHIDGITEDILIHIEKEALGFSIEEYPLFISQVEKALIDSFMNTARKNNTPSPLLIKDYTTAISSKSDHYREKIQSAIDQHKIISFCYSSPNIEPTQMIIAPELLYHNLTDNNLYCISIIENTIQAFRLDRMQRLHISNQTFESCVNLDYFLQLFDYFWGADFDISQQKYHVKLRITPSSNNIISKIKSDTLRRKYGKLYQKNDIWYYEDDIIGLNSFRSWLYQYGSAIVVLEPKELAKQVYESAKQRLNNYEENRFL